MILYRSGYKYQLATTYQVIITALAGLSIDTEFITIKPGGWLEIRSGYAWDGPSGPTKAISEILVKIPFVGTWLLDKFIKSFMRGSLVHDALYQLIRTGLLDPEWRGPADRELKLICLQDGMSKARAFYVYKALRAAGSFAASPDNKKKVYTAP